MRTWAVLAAVAVVAVAATADTLRGRTHSSSKPTVKAQAAGPTTTAARFSNDMGALYYSDAQDCFLHGVTLPNFTNVSSDPEFGPPPKLRSCRFSLSPNGQAAQPGEAAWSPLGGVFARERRGTITLGSPGSNRTALRFPGRAPAFKPDGTFTYVRGQTVVEWTTNCPRGSRLFTLPGDNATARCARDVLRRRDLERALALDRGIPSESRFVRHLATTELSWLSDTRVLVGLSVNAHFVGRRALVGIFEGRRLVGGVLFAAEPIEVEPSPQGSFFAVRTGPERVAVRDRDGNTIAFPPLTGVRAIAWSPDERWTAAATGHSVFLFRTDEGEARIRRLPLAARDLAWR